MSVYSVARELFFDCRVKITTATFRWGHLIQLGNMGNAVSSPSDVWGRVFCLVYFSLKIWQLVARILMILLRINWPAYQKIYLSKKSTGKYHVWPTGKFMGVTDPPDPEFPCPWVYLPVAVDGSSVVYTIRRDSVFQWSFMFLSLCVLFLLFFYFSSFSGLVFNISSYSLSAHHNSYSVSVHRSL